jgi:hypothetical protein
VSPDSLQRSPREWQSTLAVQPSMTGLSSLCVLLFRGGLLWNREGYEAAEFEKLLANNSIWQLGDCL